MENSPDPVSSDTFRFLCVCDTDSRIKWCRVVSETFRARGYKGDFILYRTPASATSSQVVAAQVEPSREMSDLRAIARAVVDAMPEAVLLGLGGAAFRSFQRELQREIEARCVMRRPILVCGFYGLLYENRLTGALDRLGCDVVCVNTENERTLFLEFCERLGFNGDVFVVTGLFMLEGSPGCPRVPPMPGKGRMVTFAAQPAVPALFRERAYIVSRLADYARAHPGDTVAIKTRTPLDGRATHKESFRYDYIRPSGSLTLPANMRIVHDDMKPILARTDILVTVSSTAALEALHEGCRVLVLADFGVIQRYGTHAFLDSGLLADIDALWSDDLPPPRQEWLERLGLANGSNLEVVVDRVEDLLARQATQGAPLEMPNGHAGVADADAFTRWMDRQQTPAGTMRYRISQFAYFLSRFLRQ